MTNDNRVNEKLLRSLRNILSCSTTCSPEVEVMAKDAIAYAELDSIIDTYSNDLDRLLRYEL